MATYYLDASVASVGGSGSGTLGDPFVKTDDLVNYAFTQVAAGSGYGASGDTFIVLAGALKNTTQIDLRLLDGTTTTAGNNIRPVWIKTTSPTTILDWDCGGTNFLHYPTQAIKFAGFRFYNYTNSVANPNHYPFYVYRYNSFINCIFDSYALTHYGLLYMNIHCSLIGCKFINDNRDALGNANFGYQVIGSSGVFRGNYFETTTTGGPQYYSHNFGGNINGNIFYNEIDYLNGLHVPTTGARYYGNIFYNNSASPKRAIYHPSNYENGHLIANNYFEGWSEAVHTVTGRLTLEWVVGNKGYNLSNGYLFTPQFVENDSTLWDFDDPYFKNEMLSESALADPANKDFTPNALLLGSGFSIIKESQAVNIGNKAENVGAILPNSATNRIRDIY